MVFAKKACSHQDSTLDLKSPATPFLVFVDQLVQLMFLFVAKFLLNIRSFSRNNSGSPYILVVIMEH
jgi:hypothetical protein